MVLGILLRKYDNIKPEDFFRLFFVFFYNTEILKENTEILKVAPHGLSLRHKESYNTFLYANHEEHKDFALCSQSYPLNTEIL